MDCMKAIYFVRPCYPSNGRPAQINIDTHAQSIHGKALTLLLAMQECSLKAAQTLQLAPISTQSSAGHQLILLGRLKDCLKEF